jgi:CheY-like chemotaxis protein
MARILIVEDEGILAFKTQMDLEQMGHEVVGIADNGNGAIEIAEKDNPDLILMDIVLKGSINGIETSMIIREKYECRIIYMTAHTDDVTLDAAKSTKHVGFLYKPFEPYQLIKVIDETLAK